ncbi:hypothetical protein IWZ01DRAFT_551868 [Phyllosticta capitalensis]
MNPLFLLILLAMLPNGILERLTDAGIVFSRSSMFTSNIDLIMDRVGPAGFAFCCLILYISSSTLLVVLQEQVLRSAFVQSAMGYVTNFLTARTFLSILDFLCALFAAFGFGYLLACQSVLVSRLAANIYISTIPKALSIATVIWPIVDSSILFFGCIHELFCLPEKLLCLMAFLLLTGTFLISSCVLALAVTSFITELAYFFVLEFKKTCFDTHVLRNLADECFLFLYLYDGTIKFQPGDIPTPSCTSSPISSTTAQVIHHIRSVSCGPKVSEATKISAHPSSASGQCTVVPQNSRGSTPSIDLSGQSSTPSRPISRSSHPTTVSELDEFIKIVDDCMDRIQVLESDNETLRKSNGHVLELQLENEMLRVKYEHSRDDVLRHEQNFQGAVKGIEFLEAANAELLEQNHYLRQKLAEDEEEGEARLKEFVKSFCPQHLDIFTDAPPSCQSLHSSLLITPEAPVSDKTSAKNVPLLPETPSSGPSLPFSPRTPTEHSIGHISPTSLIKPLNPRTPTGPGLPTPEAMKRQFDPTVKIVVPHCPDTVSTRNSLPCPTSASTNSSYVFEFDEPADHSPTPSLSSIKKYNQGVRLFPARPGLPCPMREVFGDRIPSENSPTITDNSPPLPRPTPIPEPSRFGRVSINSLNRPYFGGRGGHVESPLAKRGKNVHFFSPFSSSNMHVDPVSSIDRPQYKSSAARARAQRFVNSMDFQGSPSYASSNGSPLPAPSPRPSDTSDYDPFI